MKNVSHAFLGLFFIVLGISSILLASFLLALIFTGRWSLDEMTKAIAFFIGFAFGIGLNCAYFDKSKTKS